MSYTLEPVIQSCELIRLWGSKEMLQQRRCAATSTKRYIKHGGLRGTIKWRENAILELSPLPFPLYFRFSFFLAFCFFCFRFCVKFIFYLRFLLLFVFSFSFYFGCARSSNLVAFSLFHTRCPILFAVFFSVCV